MGITISTIVLAITAIGLLFGALFGLIRGRDRAILRLVLVIVSVILALALRGAVVDTIMNLEIDGESIQETLMEEFSSGEDALPEGLQNLIFALIEIVAGFAVYFVLLFLLRFVTWFFLFPFLKLIIRSIEKKRAIKLWNERKEAAVTEGDESSSNIENITDKPTRKERKKLVKKHRGWGALVGLVQGILLAYFLFAPITCLISQAETIVTSLGELEIDGEPVLNPDDIPDEIGLFEYTSSVPGKIYASTGGWLYSIMTTTTDADGKEVSLEVLLDSATVIIQVADTAMSLEEEISILQKEDVTDEEIIEAVNSIGDKIIAIGNSMEELDEDTVDMLTDIIVEAAGEDAPKEEIDKFVEILTPENLVQAGNGIKSLATYAEIKNEDRAVTAEDAKQIVGGINSFLPIIDAVEEVAEEDLSEDFVLEIDDEDKAVFSAAIEGLEGASADDKEALYKIFGIEN